MTDVVYTPPENDRNFPTSTRQFGYVFEAGKPVSVTDEKHLAVFSGNRFFTVGEKELKPQKPAEIQKTEKSPEPLPEEKAQKYQASGLKAASEGRERTVPPVYSKIAGGPEAWLAGFDSYKPE